MTIALPDLVGKVRIDDSTIDKTLATTKGKFQSFGAGLSKVGLGLTAVLTAPLIGFGAMAVKEAGEARQALAQTEAVIKSTGGAANVTVPQIAALSDRLGKMAGVEGEVVQAGANMLLTFTNVRNEAGKGNDVFNQATETLADMSVALGTDMKTSAIQLGKALNDPIKGITALQRVGVTFTEQQKEQIKTLVESGDVMGAQKIILAELNKEFGGSAKAAGDSLPPMEKLKLTMADLGESIGGILIPFLDKAAAAVSKWTDKFKELTPQQQELIVKIGLVAVALGPLLIGLGSVVGALTKLSPLLKAIPALLSVIAAHPIAAAVLALGAALIYAYTHSEKFRDIVDKAFVGLKVAVATAVEVVVGLLQGLVNQWLSVAGAFVKGAALAFSWVPGVGPKLKEADAAFEEFRASVDSKFEAIKTAAGEFKDKTIADAQAAADGAAAPWPGMTSKTQALWNSMSIQIRSESEATRAKLVADAGGIGRAVDALPTVKSIDIKAIDNASATMRHIIATLNAITSKTVTVTTLRRDTGNIGNVHRGGPILHGGGAVEKMHSGGIKSNERLALLQVGEFVLQRKAVRALGQSTLHALNALRGNAQPMLAGAASGGTYNLTFNLPFVVDPGNPQATLKATRWIRDAILGIEKGAR